MNIILITGASSGIGREFAVQMDKAFSNIDEIWVVARNEILLKQLQKELSHKTRCFPIDITEREQVDELESALRTENARICVLVNSAGYGIMGQVADMTQKESLGMIRLNCEALTDLTIRAIPYMKKNGRIIQMASSAAFLPQPGFAIYAASKAYVLSFSRALKTELQKKGISVTAVCPGPVDTPFFEIAERHVNTMPIKRLIMTTPEKVVKKALFDAYHKKSRSVCSIPMQTFELICKLMPHDLLLTCIYGMKGRSK